MTLPALSVQIQGQGSVSADNLNTYFQTCTNIAQLRAFTGVDGIEVFVRGAVTAGDGGGGNYYWNSQSTAADNGTTVIVPVGSVKGAWLLIPIGAQQLPPFLSASFYDVPVYMEGMPSNMETYPVYNAVRAVYLPANLTGSIFTIGVNPTSTFTITLNKNGTSIGTIAFSTLGVVTVTFTSNVNFVAGNQFSITWPSPQDASGANVALTFVFSVGTAT